MTLGGRPCPDSPKVGVDGAHIIKSTTVPRRLCRYIARPAISEQRLSLTEGGKTVLIGISRYVANKRLRSVLIQGARAYVHRLKDPKTPKERWLWALIQRAGYGRAAVALANKNARTAWALLTQGAEYKREYGVALAA